MRPSLLLVVVLAAGCNAERSSAETAPGRRAVVTAPAVGTFTDSATRRMELDEFRTGLAKPLVLSGGAESAEALVRKWMEALQRADTAALASLVLSRAEFGWLYYPSSPMSRPPYDLDPELMWFQLAGNSAKGLREVLEKRGGRPLGFRDFRCDPHVMQGRNRFHGGCVVVREDEGGVVTEERLFGALLERDGRWKFVSWSARL